MSMPIAHLCLHVQVPVDKRPKLMASNGVVAVGLT